MRKFDRNVKETISEAEEKAMKEALSGLCIDLSLTQEIKKFNIRLDSEIEEITTEKYLAIAKENYDNNACTNELERVIGEYANTELAFEFAEAMVATINKRRKASAEKTAERNNHIIKIVRSIVDYKVKTGDAFLLSGMTVETENFINGHHPRIVGKALDILVEEGILKKERRKLFSKIKTFYIKIAE